MVTSWTAVEIVSDPELASGRGVRPDAEYLLLRAIFETSGWRSTLAPGMGHEPVADHAAVPVEEGEALVAICQDGPAPVVFEPVVQEHKRTSLSALV